MKLKEKIIKDIIFCITKAEKESLNILIKYCEGSRCSECQFNEMCSKATLAERLEQFLNVVEIEN